LCVKVPTNKANAALSLITSFVTGNEYLPYVSTCESPPYSDVSSSSQSFGLDLKHMSIDEIQQELVNGQLLHDKKMSHFESKLNELSSISLD
jgi:hypothetical protein